MRTSKRYRGFVCYCRKDERRARRLHRALESYRVPSRIDCVGLLPGRKLGSFFLDDEESAANPSLDAFLRGALEESMNLIVVCSPASARSEWVGKEVQYFAGLGRPVLAVILKGEPHAVVPERECYSPALLKLDPLAVRWRRGSFARVRTKLVAELLGIEFNNLWRRERRRRTRRRMIGCFLGLLVAVILFSTVVLVREWQFASVLAGRAQELLERRQFRLEGKYATNESLIGVRQYREALPVALASLPRSSDLIPYDGPITDCGSFGRIPACRCVALRVAFAMPQQIQVLPIKLGAGGKMVFDESLNLKCVVTDGYLYCFEITRQEPVLKPKVKTFWGPLDASRDAIAFTDEKNSGFVRVYDPAEEKFSFDGRVFDSPIVGLRFSPDGAEIASLSNHREVAWLVRGGSSGKAPWTVQRRLKLGAGDAPGGALEYARDGVLLATLGPPAQLFRVARGGTAVYRELKVKGTPNRLKPSSTGRFVAVAGDTSVALVDFLRTDAAVLPYQHAQNISALDFSPDDRLLLSGSFDNNVVVWNIEANEIETVFSHGWHVQEACFLGGGSRIMASTHQGDVWVWDLATRAELLRINGTGQTFPILDPEHGRFIAQPENGPVALFELRDLSNLSSSQMREKLAAEQDPATDLRKLHAAFGFEGRPHDLREWQGLKRFAGWVQMGRRLAIQCGLLDDYAR
jgi:MTH538 TIR-like domain (DUF1863)/WD domain, G-beta repeat